MTAAAALGLVGAVALQAQPNVFDTIEKMKMSWDLTYKLKPGDSVKYEIGTISSQKVNAFNVAEAGSEESSDTGTTTRVYLTQKVLDVERIAIEHTPSRRREPVAGGAWTQSCESGRVRSERRSYPSWLAHLDGW